MHTKTLIGQCDPRLCVAQQLPRRVVNDGETFVAPYHPCIYVKGGPENVYIPMPNCGRASYTINQQFFLSKQKGFYLLV